MAARLLRAGAKITSSSPAVAITSDRRSLIWYAIEMICRKPEPVSGFEPLTVRLQGQRR
jgi:hypothetical protein